MAVTKKSDVEKPVKRTRKPSAYNKYMAVRLAEMKADEAFMAENPDHRQRFKMAAHEWSAMTPDQKAEYSEAEEPEAEAQVPEEAQEPEEPEAEPVPEPVPVVEEPKAQAAKPKRGRKPKGTAAA
jgi:hypothetical protein